MSVQKTRVQNLVGSRSLPRIFQVSAEGRSLGCGVLARGRKIALGKLEGRPRGKSDHTFALVPRESAIPLPLGGQPVP